MATDSESTGRNITLPQFTSDAKIALLTADRYVYVLLNAVLGL